MTTAKKTRILFAFERETKNTYRFTELDENDQPADEPIIGTLYIKKSYFDAGKPESITVTISE